MDTAHNNTITEDKFRIVSKVSLLSRTDRSLPNFHSSQTRFRSVVRRYGNKTTGFTVLPRMKTGTPQKVRGELVTTRNEQFSVGREEGMQKTPYNPSYIKTLKSVSKRNGELLEENAVLKEEIKGLKGEIEELNKFFHRLQNEYNGEKEGKAYDERRFILLKSLLMQKDRFITLITESASELRQLVEKSHEIIVKMFEHLKERKIFAEKATSKTETNEAKAKRAAELLAGLKKEIGNITKHESTIKPMIYEYLRMHKAHCGTATEVNKIHANMVHHISPATLIKEASKSDSYSINQGKIFKLEGEINVLLNNLVSTFKNSVPPAGFNLEQAKTYISLSQNLKDCAEGILDLGIASNLVAKPANNLRLHYHKQKDAKINKVISEAYANLALNPATINNLLSVATMGSKHDLLEILTKLRDHELSLILGKNLAEYENSVLRKTVDNFLIAMKMCQAEVTQVFDKLESSAKDRILGRLKVINGSLKKSKTMNDEYLKKAEMELVGKVVTELIAYVSNIFDVKELKAARKEAEEKLDALKLYKIALEKPVKT